MSSKFGAILLKRFTENFTFVKRLNFCAFMENLNVSEIFKITMFRLFR